MWAIQEANESGHKSTKKYKPTTSVITGVDGIQNSAFIDNREVGEELCSKPRDPNDSDALSGHEGMADSQAPNPEDSLPRASQQQQQQQSMLQQASHERK